MVAEAPTEATQVRASLLETGPRGDGDPLGGSCSMDLESTGCTPPTDARGMPTGQPCFGPPCTGGGFAGTRRASRGRGEIPSGGAESAGPPKAACTATRLGREIFEGYTALLASADSEVVRTQRWRCSWLYTLRACDKAEGMLRLAGGGYGGGYRPGSCRAVLPPNYGGRLGWQGHTVANISAQELGALLFKWRCW
jgi:hypothetical protein